MVVRVPPLAFASGGTFFSRTFVLDILVRSDRVVRDSLSLLCFARYLDPLGRVAVGYLSFPFRLVR